MTAPARVLAEVEREQYARPSRTPRYPEPAHVYAERQRVLREALSPDTRRCPHCLAYICVTRAGRFHAHRVDPCPAAPYVQCPGSRLDADPTPGADHD